MLLTYQSYTLLNTLGLYSKLNKHKTNWIQKQKKYGIYLNLHIYKAAETKARAIVDQHFLLFTLRMYL